MNNTLGFAESIELIDVLCRGNAALNDTNTHINLRYQSVIMPKADPRPKFDGINQETWDFFLNPEFRDDLTVTSGELMLLERGI